MSAVIDNHAGHDAHDDHGHHPTGLMRWVTSTNHKDIGTMYLWFSFVMFLVGGVMALTIRAELFTPGIQIVSPEFFNQMTTYHGLIMVFGAIMPAFVGFANWQIPLMIGAPDMAFPRMNNWSFWLLPPAAIMLMSSFLMPGGAAGVGWTMYAPLTTQMGPGMDTTIFAVHLLGMSSIMGSINIITTILNMRAPGMTLMKIPMFVWTWLITAYLLIAVMPVLAGAVTMTLTDRHFGTTFFNAAGGGDPVLYQHIFWFFGHPEVYIIAIPAFGVISQVIPAFSRKPLFGFVSLGFAMGEHGVEHHAENTDEYDHADPGHQIVQVVHYLRRLGDPRGHVQLPGGIGDTCLQREQQCPSPTPEFLRHHVLTVFTISILPAAKPAQHHGQRLPALPHRKLKPLPAANGLAIQSPQEECPHRP